MLKLMYITNETDIAKIAEDSGVDRIWIDLEVNGKEERQKNMDTVKSKHSINDVGKIKKVLTTADLIVRVNPIYEGSKEEIDSVINQGADIVMLPFFKTVKEVKIFIELVNKRVRTCLLCETPEAVENLDEILEIPGIDEIHIGLNDLHLGYHKKFMFELLSDGTVEKICNKIRNKQIPYGFGGISRIGSGTLKAENIITEHYRLRSEIAILSRAFCNTQIIKDREEIKNIFDKEVEKVRQFEKQLANFTEDQFNENKKAVQLMVNDILKNM